MLVVLDDARDADQVRPLLPGGSGNAVLVTSRDGLSGLVVREGAVRISVGGLAEAEAYALLAVVLGDERVAADPEATANLARQCRYLPLALRLAATTLDGQPRLSVADYAAAIGRAGFGDMGGVLDLGLERLYAALTV